MKIKRLLAALLAAAVSLSIFAVPSFAAEEAHNHTEIIFHEEASAKIKDKAIAYFLSGAHENDDDSVVTYGLTCTLLGHNNESVVSSVITHKAKTTSPRCLKKTYRYYACSRCDYEYSELLYSEYIICCA